MLGCLRKLLTNNVQSVRFFGSGVLICVCSKGIILLILGRAAALNMCSVACGRADVYFEGHTSKIGPKPWFAQLSAQLFSQLTRVRVGISLQLKSY